MVWVDFLILLVLVVSAVISLFRGFVREALSLAGWITSFWIALGFSNRLAESLLTSVSIPSLRITIAFAILFVLTMVVFALINNLFGQLIKKSGLTKTDRAVGIAFGIARGVTIVAVLVLWGGVNEMPKEAWWLDSLLLDKFYGVSIWLQDSVAPEIKAYFFQR